MKIILDLALSDDNFIARLNGDSDWVSQSTESLFKQRIKELGGLVVGRKTFEQYYRKIYPVSEVLNFVLSKSAFKCSEPNVIVVSSLQEAISKALENKCHGLLIAGGASINKAFLSLNLIDEIYYSIHPIKLGEGMKPFGDMPQPSNLKLIETVNLEDGVIQRHYQVK